MKALLFATALLILNLDPLGAQEAPPAPATPAAVPHRSEDVRYTNGEIPLAAELLLPEGEGPFPGAVIIQGSGTSDRGNAWARSIAEVLVGEGVGVLLTDKRGSGESGGDWRTVGFGDLAGDALAGVAFLRGRTEVDPERIGLVGLSQGGWVAPITASVRPREIAFVITVSSAAVGFAEQTTLEMANTARQAGLAAEEIAEVLELHRQAGRYLSTAEWEPYAQALEAARGKPWGAIAAGFPASRELPIWTFLRRVYAFDPIPYWLAVPQPTLILYGEEDEKDNVPVAESVRRLEFAFGLTGKTNARIRVLPGAGHGFQKSGTGELLATFTEELTGWVREQVARKAADQEGVEGPNP